MARSFPAGANCAVLGRMSIYLSGSNVVANLFYEIATRFQDAQSVWHVASVPWMLLGTGTISVTEPLTTSVGDVQTAIINSLKTTEGLTTGDFIIYPDGTVVTL